MNAQTEPLDVLAALRQMQANSSHFRNGLPVLADHHTGEFEREQAALSAIADLISELQKAHQIILIALNTLPPGAKRTFEQKVIGAGLDGEGTTRFHERRAALARVGGAA